jgi:transposase
VVFGTRLPRSLTPSFKAEALVLAQGVPGLASAMRGLLDARDAVLAAIAAIDRDMRAMARKSEACRLLMGVPGVGPITALAFAAAIDEPIRFRRSREVGAYLSLTPRRHQSGEIDDDGSITKQGDTRLRTLLHEAAGVMLTRTKADFAFKG